MEIFSDCASRLFNWSISDAVEWSRMKTDLSVSHRAVLYEMRWHGGVLFVSKGANARIFRELVEARYVFREQAGPEKYRYELTLRARNELQGDLLPNGEHPSVRE